MNEQRQPMYANAGPARTTCQQCGSPFAFLQHHCFSYMDNPQYADILLRDDFFKPVCPECGGVAELCYASRCVDSLHKLCVVLRPGIEEEDTDAVCGEMNKRLSELGGNDWRRRAVGNFQSMQEQLIIRMANLDDRVIQLLKPLIIGQMQASGKEVWNGFFTHAEHSPDSSHENVLIMAEDNELEAAYKEPLLWFRIILTNGEQEKQGINHTAYRLCQRMLERGKMAEDCGEFQHFDLSWAISYHNSGNQM